MISERKLRSIQPKSRLRKIGKILRRTEEELRHGSEPDSDSIEMLLRNAGELIDIGPSTDALPESREGLLRRLSSARHAILNHLGENPAEWDLLPPLHNTPVSISVSDPRHTSQCVDSRGRYRGDDRLRVYLDEIRSPFNVGSIFRTAAAFCVAEILISEYCVRPDHPRAMRSSMGSVDLIPWRISGSEELEAISKSDGVFALETGGTATREFSFPETGTIILGNEEFGISPECRRIASKNAGICSIDLRGPKTSVNVSVAFGIAVHEWSSRYS